MPSARTEVAVAEVDGKIYVVGGFGGERLRVAQSHCEHALLEGFENDGMLTPGKDNAAELGHAFTAHRLTDHCESIYSDPAVRYNVVGRVEVSFIDRSSRHKAANFNRARTF